MDDIIRKECETLKLMMSNWRTGFKTWHQPGVDNSYILKEFHEEISDQLLPYVYRLMESGHLSHEEALKLMHDCYAEVDILEKELEEMDGCS